MLSRWRVHSTHNPANPAIICPYSHNALIVYKPLERLLHYCFQYLSALPGGVFRWRLQSFYPATEESKLSKMENLPWRSLQSSGSRRKHIITKETIADVKCRSSPEMEKWALLERWEVQGRFPRKGHPKGQDLLLQHLHKWSPKMLVEWMNDINIHVFFHSLNILDHRDILEIYAPTHYAALAKNITLELYKSRPAFSISDVNGGCQPGGGDQVSFSVHSWDSVIIQKCVLLCFLGDGTSIVYLKTVSSSAKHQFT